MGRSTAPTSSELEPIRRQVMLLGDPGVGKTCLCVRACSEHFVEEMDPTIEDIYSKHVEVNEKAVVIEFFDGGISNRPAFYMNAPASLLIYSITSRSSFSKLEEYYQTLQKMCDSETVPVVIIGNRCDLEPDREVSREEGEKFALALGVPFFETSAKTGAQVAELCALLAQRILEAKPLPKPRVRREPRCVIL